MTADCIGRKASAGEAASQSRGISVGHRGSRRKEKNCFLLADLVGLPASPRTILRKPSCHQVAVMSLLRSYLPTPSAFLPRLLRPSRNRPPVTKWPSCPSLTHVRLPSPLPFFQAHEHDRLLFLAPLKWPIVIWIAQRCRAQTRSELRLHHRLTAELSCEQCGAAHSFDVAYSYGVRA
jgi:hypothetical protein